MTQDLDVLWEAYRDAVRAGGNPRELYDRMVWPALLARWRREPQVYPYRRRFSVSIHTLGTSPEATTLAVLGVGASQVYVLHTKESSSFLPRLRDDTGKDVYPIEVEKGDVASIYRHVKELLEKHPGEAVALDLTSGTKAMSAGLAAAGFFFQRFYPDVRVVYVDNEDYDPELRRPRAGTERLVVLPNPHEVLAEVDALLARELYEKREFRKAGDLFGRMVEKTGDRRHELYALLAGMYRGWYSLDFAEALRSGCKLLARLEQDVWLTHPLNRHRQVLEAQVALLQGVEAFLNDGDFGQARGVYGLAATLLRLSAEAREGSQALAALYAYRALELLLQERAALLGRRAEAPGLTAEEEEGLRRELAAILKTPEGEVWLAPKLGLLDLVAFLRLKGDPVVSRRSLAELQGLSGVLKARNESLLVHGLRVPSRREPQQIHDLARQLLEDLGSRAGGNLSVEPVPLDPPD